MCARIAVRRFGGAYERKPMWIRPGARAGNDLNGLAVLQLCPQWYEAPVDLRRDATIANARVHGVGEVNRRSALGQRHDVALGGEYVNLVREQVDLDALQELLGGP